MLRREKLLMLQLVIKIKNQPLFNDVGNSFSDLQTNNVQFIKKLEGLPNYHH